MDFEQLRIFVKKLIDGLFGVQMVLMENTRDEIRAYYKRNLPDFLAEESKAQMEEQIASAAQSNVVSHYSDSMLTHYLLLPIEERVVMLGPYTPMEISQEQEEQILQKLTLPSSLYTAFHLYCQRLPVCQNSNLIFVARLVYREIYSEGIAPPLVSYWLQAPLFSEALLQEPSEGYDATMRMLQARYQDARSIYHEVSLGNFERARELHRKHWEQLKIIRRFADPLRNRKNLVIIHNTNLRLTAEKVAVHPFYLDSISNHYAIAIEAAPSIEALGQLQYEMLYKYCELINRQSLQGFSPLVRKALIYIRFHPSDMLDLQTIAEKVKVDAFTLSRKFNKELGESIPNYINRFRCEKAAEMFCYSSASVKEIGAYVGFMDLNYFSKVFKKYLGASPRQYQEEHCYR